MLEGYPPPHQRSAVRRPWSQQPPFRSPAAGRRRKPIRRSWRAELMHLAHYLGLVHRSELMLASSFREVASAHGDEPDVSVLCQKFAKQCDQHAAKLAPFVDRYGEEAPEEPERLHVDLFGGTRTGGLGLLRDLHDLYLMASEVDISWTLVGQAAQGARDKALFETVTACDKQTATQLEWLRTRMKQAAPQALLVAS